VGRDARRANDFTGFILSGQVDTGAQLMFTMVDLYLEPLVRPYVPDSLVGKVALITGASRGIGAQIASDFSKAGAEVVINYRSKGERAEEVASAIRAAGKNALPIQADLTNEAEVAEMMSAANAQFGGLDYLILNASGGLEKGKSENYSLLLNCTAQVNTLKLAIPFLRPSARVVFVTSHLAHFYGVKPVYPAYEPVAIGKNAGERALLQRVPELTARSISLIVVSGDMIDGTITPKLLNRQNRGIIDSRKSAAGRLPTVDEFAKSIVDAAADESLPTGQIVLVGTAD
jgi:3-oxoacyl-[acyl-carrier protein] reductase